MQQLFAPGLTRSAFYCIMSDVLIVSAVGPLSGTVCGVCGRVMAMIYGSLTLISDNFDSPLPVRGFDFGVLNKGPCYGRGKDIHTA